MTKQETREIISRVSYFVRLTEIIQSKTVFGYRVSYYTTTSISRLHDIQRFPMHNILSKIYSDEQRSAYS